MTEAWITFLGRLHPLVLHLPLGLVGMIVVLEAWGKLKVGARFQPSQRSLLAVVLFLSATAAAVSGWQLGVENGYSSGGFLWHRGLGIAFVGAALLMASASLLSKRGLYRASLVLALVLAGAAGHLGAGLTHGEDFLFEPFQASEQEQPPSKVQEVLDVLGLPSEPPALVELVPAPQATQATWYDERIAPIFEAYCTKCHGEKKQKGDLALHTGEIVLAGSEFGPVVIPGDPDESLILQRLRLPLEDDDRMPPAKKPQPTDEEIAELLRWVAAGASLEALAPE